MGVVLFVTLCLRIYIEVVLNRKYGSAGSGVCRVSILLRGIIVDISCTRVDRPSTVASEFVPVIGVETAFTEPPLSLLPSCLVPVNTDPLFSCRFFALALRCEYFFFTLEARGTAFGLSLELFFVLPFGISFRDSIASFRISWSSSSVWVWRRARNRIGISVR